MTARRLAALAALLAIAACGHAREIALRPGMPALAPVGVPLLWETLPSVDRLHMDASLTPQQAYQWVIDPGTPFRCELSVGAKAAADRSVLTVWDWNRTPVAQASLTSPATEPLVFSVAGRGTYLLTLDLFAAGKCIGRLPRSFSVCPSNVQRRADFGGDEFFIGTCSFPDRQHWANDYGPGNPTGMTEQQSRDREAELTARLGMQVVRIGPLGYWFDPAKPMDFERADACVQSLVSRGIKLDLQLGLGFDWMIQDQYRDVKDPKWRYPPNEEPSRRFTRATVERYAKHAEFVEVGNEPDNKDFWRGTPEQYIDFYKWTVDEIRKAAPRATIANGGYCFIEPVWSGKFARGLKGLTDWVAYHSHGDIPAIVSSFGTLQAIHAAAGYDKPVFVNTEMGYAAWRLDIEREMAATAVQKLLYCWAHGHRGALLFCSREIGGPRGGDWGYLDYTFCPRFMYGAVAAVVDWYAGARFDSILAEGPGLHAYAFKTGQKRIVSVFAPDNQDKPVALTSDATRATVVDPMGNATQMDQGRTVTLTASYYPTTVVFEGASHVEMTQK